MNKPINVSTKLSDGREISIETGKLAKQADGSVVLKMGKTMILASVVSKPEAMDNVDFLPLSVDYQEKFASAGKIPGGFLKREGRLSDHEVLICRLVDRVLRPLFPSDYHADTQVLIYLISADKDVLPDALAALAASAALTISDIPFNGPISEVRVVKTDGKYVVNPTQEQIDNSTLNLMVGASAENICMVEGESKEVSEDEIVEALEVAHDAIKDLCKLQNDLLKKIGGIDKRDYSHENSDEEMEKDIRDKTYDDLYKIAQEGISNKKKEEIHSKK
tara:strand:- start:2098 stop:2928 length:831 start_codon:yes stop_codon:yes gene_type:complete